MKPVSPELLTLLSSRQFFVADLYTFQLANGVTLTYCGGDQAIVANGITFPAGGQIGPYFDRTDSKAKCHWKIGMEVDSLVFDVLPGSATISGTPFLTAVRQGLFDGAEVILDRAYMPTYGDTSRGLVRYFVGRVAEVDCGRSIATFTVNSHLELLNLQLPRNLYQPGCVNSLGDAACGVDLTNPAYHTTGAVVAGTTAATINAYLATVPQTGAFDLGTIAFTSGALAGQTYGVKQCVFGSTHVISLTGFMACAPAVGDTFTITFGCDKTSGLPWRVNGNCAKGSTAIGNPSYYGQNMVGMVVSGPGFPEGTTVTAAGPGAVVLSAASTANITSGEWTMAPPAGTPQNGCAKFNNLARFRGFPFVPQPVTAA